MDEGDSSIVITPLLFAFLQSCARHTPHPALIFFRLSPERLRLHGVPPTAFLQDCKQVFVKIASRIQCPWCCVRPSTSPPFHPFSRSHWGCKRLFFGLSHKRANSLQEERWRCTFCAASANWRTPHDAAKQGSVVPCRCWIIKAADVAGGCLCCCMQQCIREHFATSDL